LFYWRFSRHCDRRFAWPWSHRDHCHAAARHVRLAAGVRAHYARGDLLWFPVRRFDYLPPRPLPGQAASVVTTLDGYQMAKQGRAGAALAASAIGSFFAGTVSTFLIAGFGPPLAAVALKFGPAEFFSLMVLSLVASVVLAQGSLLHAIGMVVLGLLLG